MTFAELLAQATAGTLQGSTFRGTQAPSIEASIVPDAFQSYVDDPLEAVLMDAEIRGNLHPALSNGRDPLCLLLEAEEQGHFSFYDSIIGA